ncbi:hypothetical protein E4U45_007528, partial [Claviceps purpurea]
MIPTGSDHQLRASTINRSDKNGASSELASESSDLRICAWSLRAGDGLLDPLHKVIACLDVYGLLFSNPERPMRN